MTKRNRVTDFFFFFKSYFILFCALGQANRLVLLSVCGSTEAAANLGIQNQNKLVISCGAVYPVEFLVVLL